MRVLALDVGDERIGVAISDAGGHLARPLEIVSRASGQASFLHLAEIIEKNKIERLVIGLPLLADGSEGKQVASVRAYLRGLEPHLTIPHEFWDERLSSRRAAEIMVETDRRNRRRAKNDAIAAAVILQEYLDSLSGGPAL